MTRNTWLTVRLPGASTAPATSTRMWFQTGAVKHGRGVSDAPPLSDAQAQALKRKRQAQKTARKANRRR